ncbi:MAG: FAD-binding oxidoreductase [Thermoleophilales bacterium]|nr:FAD-binding oxidoreductase [Thermoleophilales bacterium]
MDGSEFDGDLIKRGEGGYERARREAVWNGRMPERMPDVIVRAATEDDVARAVRLAAREGLRVGVRSGGHSWAGNHVRDGGMLLDVSRLRAAEVDAESRAARVQPGLPGNELIARLAEEDLFFPAGHCPGVALGGYLLQGGFGWNGRVHGPACMSVEAVDLVTADGELLRADARQDADLLWAARGSGPGFFAAVTGFHVRLQPRPRVVANALFTYPVECLEPVFTWAQEVATEVRRTTEMMLFIHRGEDGEPEIVVTGPTLVDDPDEARDALAVLATCPVRSRARIEVPYIEATMADLYAGAHASYPDGSRYGVDNMWTHAPAAELMPLFDRIVETIPEAPSHMLWMNWGPGSEPAPARPDMAFSVEDDTYIALYGVWTDPADDAANVAWATDLMRAGEEHASGIQLADENLAERPARFIDEERMARLDALRDEWDPEGRFHPWMGRL